MGGCSHFNFLPLFFFFILLLLLVLCPSISSQTLGFDACTLAFCGEGTCVISSSTSYGYDCVCNHGWQTISVFGFISCALPNCTIDLTCGSHAPPPPPPPAPPLNLSSPCNFVLCGEGSCAPNGTGHYCQCNPDSFNLLNNTFLPCIKKCSLGLDCYGVELGDPPPPPPPNGTLAPPRSPPNGSENMSKRWSSSMIFLSTIILAWIVYE